MEIGAPNCEQWQRRSRDDARQRDVAANGKYKAPDQYENYDGSGHQCDQHTGRCGDALATFEADPWRIVVAENCAKPSEDLENLRREHRVIFRVWLQDFQTQWIFHADEMDQ